MLDPSNALQQLRIHLPVLPQPILDHFQMRVIRPLRELSVDRFRVHLLDASQALQIQTAQKPFEQGIDVDVPQIRVLVDAGLDLEHEFGQCLQRVGHTGELEPMLWVAEHH